MIGLGDNTLQVTHTHIHMQVLESSWAGLTHTIYSLSLFNLVTHREVDCPQVSWRKMNNSPQGPLAPLSLSLSLPFLSPPHAHPDWLSLIFFLLSPPPVISLCV